MHFSQGRAEVSEFLTRAFGQISLFRSLLSYQEITNM